MNIEAVNEVEASAILLLKRIEDVKERLDGDNYYLAGCKETAALKRQSMELTRALVGIRRSQ